jgi:hypothetical protein
MSEHEKPIKHFPADRATINGDSTATGITYGLTAIICEGPPGYRYELMEDKREIEVGVDHSDLTETVREACTRWVEVFNKKLADW